jgi:hypothetical protein
MREPIVINAETREITVPEAERAFGVAGERKVEVKHIRIEGRTVDGTDLTQGFTWKVSCENAGKELCADLIDGIVADAGNIEFDWIVGAAPMAYKGTMHFAVCAVRVDAAGNILQEWHSKLGAGDVANGIEATVQNIGGQDLLAHIQSITAAAQQNAAAAQRDAAAAAKSAEDAATSEGNAAASAKKAQTLVDGMPSDYSQAMKDIGTLKNQMQRAYPDDSTIGENPWSSKHIVDMLCPEINESGNPVLCYPVAGYPLGVKAKWEPVQEGSGTPSPENIRPIKGLDSVTVTRCGENLASNVPKSPTQNTICTIFKQKLSSATITISGHIKGTYAQRTAAILDLYDSQNGIDNYITPSMLFGTPNTTLDNDFTYTTTKSFDEIALFFMSSSYTQFSIDSELSNFSIVYGTTAPTTYTPYIGHTNTLTLPETVYGGEVDAVSGEGHRTWNLFNDLDNHYFNEGETSSGWTQSEDAVAWFVYVKGYSIKQKVLSNIFCTTFSIVNKTVPYTIGMGPDFFCFSASQKRCCH